VAARKDRATEPSHDEPRSEPGSEPRPRSDASDDDLGEGVRWGMTIGISQEGLRSQIALQHLGVPLDAPGARSELAPTVWAALCRLEKMLQARRGARTALARRSHAELLGAE
jgi:hypothetical protein